MIGRIKGMALEAELGDDEVWTSEYTGLAEFLNQNYKPSGALPALASLQQAARELGWTAEPESDEPSWKDVVH